MDIENTLYKVKEGTVVISNKDAEKSSSVIISDEGIKLTDMNAVHGIEIGNAGVTIQGDLLITGKGISIKKGEYSENPNSAKMFTYADVIFVQGDVEEKAYKEAGKMAGVNLSQLTENVWIPTFTGEAGGATLPAHVHPLFPHVHRIEPPYLYRVPGIVKLFTGCFQKLFDFFKMFGS